MPARPRDERDSEVRASRLFALTVGLGGCGALAIGIALRGADAVRVSPAGRSGHLALLGQRFTYPEVNAAAAIVLALAALGAIVVALGLRAAARELRENRRFARAVRARGVREHGDVRVFDDPRAQAFCAGLLRPRLYVSTGATRLLGEDELGAVLAHERHHRDRHDPLRIAIGRVLARALFFMPALARLHSRYCADAELAADDAAIRAQGSSPATLASAMLAFEGATHPVASVGIAPERVDHLLGRHTPRPLPLAWMVAALASALTIALAAWQLAGVAIAHVTLALPILSTQPCIVTLALIPGVLGALAVRYLRRAAP